MSSALSLLSLSLSGSRYLVSAASLYSRSVRPLSVQSSGWPPLAWRCLQQRAFACLSVNLSFYWMDVRPPHGACTPLTILAASNIQRSLSIHTITGWRNIHVAVGGSSPVHRESAILTREGLEIRTFSSSMGSVHWNKVLWFDSSFTSDPLFCFGSEEHTDKMSCQAQCRHLRAVLITRVKTDNQEEREVGVTTSKTLVMTVTARLIAVTSHRLSTCVAGLRVGS